MENNKKNFIKIVVYVPESHGDIIRKALGDNGAGTIGNYHHCSTTIKGIGRFTPDVGSNPSIGEIGKEERVVDERIETLCLKQNLPKVINAVKKAHPYEEAIIETYPMVTIH